MVAVLIVVFLLFVVADNLHAIGISLDTLIHLEKMK